MSNFTRFYLATVAFTVVTASISAGMAAIGDKNHPDIGRTMVAKIIGDNTELESVDESFPIDETFKDIEIGWPLGSVRVTTLPDGETKPKVKFTGKAAKGEERPFKVRVHEGTLQIEADEKAHKFGFIINGGNFGITSGSIDAVLELPKKWTGNLTVEVVAGDLRLPDLKFDRLEIHTVSGDVLTDAHMSAKSLTTETVSGDVKLQGSLQDVKVHSVSGDVRIELAPKGHWNYDIETVSGSVRNLMEKSGPAQGSVKIETVSGNVSIEPMGSESETR